MTRPRRTVLSLLASGLTCTIARPAFTRNLLTPDQMLGPFYPKKIPLDNDNDLTKVAGENRVARGEITHLTGRVLTPHGPPIVGAHIEIWQCDAFGYYRHPRDGSGKDSAFQGYGQTRSSNNGEYRFKTIKPVNYPGRAPHIHMRIVTKTRKLVTQIYVKGEQLNKSDFILNSTRDTPARNSLIVPFVTKAEYPSNELVAEFNPVLAV